MYLGDLNIAVLSFGDVMLEAKPLLRAFHVPDIGEETPPIPL